MFSNYNEQTRHFVQIPHKHQCDFQEIKTDALTQYKASKSERLTEFKEHMYLCADFLSGTKGKKIQKELHISVSCCLYTVLIDSEDNVQVHHSSCFLRKNCSAESH